MWTKKPFKKIIFFVKGVETLTPHSTNPNTWLLAKAEAEMAADTYCQGKIHLGGVHFVDTLYCLSFRRHLSTQHPLYDFFKYHCEATIPHITLAWATLAVPNSEGNKFYGMGSKGFIKLSTSAYDERNYEHSTYEFFIKVCLRDWLSIQVSQYNY